MFSYWFAVSSWNETLLLMLPHNVTTIELSSQAVTDGELGIIAKTFNRLMTLSISNTSKLYGTSFNYFIGNKSLKRLMFFGDGKFSFFILFSFNLIYFLSHLFSFLFFFFYLLFYFILFYFILFFLIIKFKYQLQIYWQIVGAIANKKHWYSIRIYANSRNTNESYWLCKKSCNWILFGILIFFNNYFIFILF